MSTLLRMLNSAKDQPHGLETHTMEITKTLLGLLKWAAASALVGLGLSLRHSGKNESWLVRQCAGEVRLILCRLCGKETSDLVILWQCDVVGKVQTSSE